MVWETRQVCEKTNYHSSSLTSPFLPANDDANTLGHNAAPFMPPLRISKHAQAAQPLQPYLSTMDIVHPHLRSPGSGHAHPCSLHH